MLKNITLIFVFLLLLTSCKSTKDTSNNIANLSAKNVIKKNNEVRFDKTKIKASLLVKYQGKADLPNLNASMRLVKDSVIWLSFSKLGFPIAKLMITPTEVKFYEKISRSYFVGNYEFISNLLGADFDFNKVQNLFYGETLLDLNNDKYKARVSQNAYELTPKKENKIFEILFFINPVTFKLAKEEFKQKDKDQILTILYKDFDKINESLFPKGFIIKAQGKKRKTTIDVNYKNVLFDTPISFPFKIPSGYRKIEIK